MQPQQAEEIHQPRTVYNFDISLNVVSGHLKGMGHKNYMNPQAMLEIFLNIDLK